jgi:molybdopterin/thiamine biosynthesis adenylyltransferase
MEINEKSINHTIEVLTRLYDRKHNEVSRDSGMDYVEFLKEKTMIVVGLGGVGSWLSFILSRFSPKALYLYDNDIVEEHNLGGQLFGTNMCNLKKTDVITQFIYHMNIGLNNTYIANHNVFLAHIPIILNSFPDYTFICIDNMEGRYILYEDWKNKVITVKEEFKRNKALIDIRMSIDTIQIYTVLPDEYSLQKYEESLFSDDEADAVTCNRKQTTYVCALCAGLIGNTVVEHIRYSHLGFPPPPLFREYNANILTLIER